MLSPFYRPMRRKTNKPAEGIERGRGRVTRRPRGSAGGEMAKQHGSLARAGNVRGQTPKVQKEEKKKKPRGRAFKRLKYSRRFLNVVVGIGKKKGPNTQAVPI